MRVIMRKKLIHTEPEHFTLIYLLTGSRKKGYTIKIIEYCGHRARSAETTHHVSHSKAEAVQMLKLFAAEGLFPVHLQDAVDDYHCRMQLTGDLCSMVHSA